MAEKKSQPTIKDNSLLARARQTVQDTVRMAERTFKQQKDASIKTFRKGVEKINTPETAGMADEIGRLGNVVYKGALSTEKGNGEARWSRGDLSISGGHAKNSNASWSYGKTGYIADPFTHKFASSLGDERRETGIYTEEKALELVSFLKEKLTPQQAMKALSVIQAASGVIVMGHTDRSLAAREATRQRDAHTWLRQLYGIMDDPVKIKNFFKKDSFENDPSTKGNADRVAKNAHHGEDASWTTVRQHALQPFVLHKKDTDSYLPEKKFSADELANADETLTKAVQTTGLAAVRIPRGVIYDDEAKLKLADSLVQANKDLQKVTGWQGEVLGLNRRVILEFDAHKETAVMQKDEKYIYIKTWADKLAHEWYHAVDHAQGTSVNSSLFMVKSDDMLSYKNSPKYGEITDLGDPHRLARAQHQLWKDISNPVLTKDQRISIQKEIAVHTDLNKSNTLWTSAINANTMAVQDEASKMIVLEGSPWLHWSKEMVRKERHSSTDAFLMGTDQALYAGSPAEILARSFAGYTVQSLKNDEHPALRTRDNKDGASFIVLGPTPTESLASRAAWQKHFSQTHGWWLEDTQKRKPSTAPALPIEASPSVSVAPIKAKELKIEANAGTASSDRQKMRYGK